MENRNQLLRALMVALFMPMCSGRIPDNGTGTGTGIGTGTGAGTRTRLEVRGRKRRLSGRSLQAEHNIFRHPDNPIEGTTIFYNPEETSPVSAGKANGKAVGTGNGKGGSSDSGKAGRKSGATESLAGKSGKAKLGKAKGASSKASGKANGKGEPPSLCPDEDDDQQVGIYLTQEQIVSLRPSESPVSTSRRKRNHLYQDCYDNGEGDGVNSGVYPVYTPHYHPPSATPQPPVVAKYPSHQLPPVVITYSPPPSTISQPVQSNPTPINVPFPPSFAPAIPDGTVGGSGGSSGSGSGGANGGSGNTEDHDGIGDETDGDITGEEQGGNNIIPVSPSPAPTFPLLPHSSPTELARWTRWPTSLPTNSTESIDSQQPTRTLEPTNLGGPTPIESLTPTTSITEEPSITRQLLSLAPSSAPTSAMTPVMTSAPTLSQTTHLERRETDCRAIGDGTAPTDAPKRAFNVGMDLTISNEFEFAVVVVVLQQILQSRVAPKVAGCPPVIAIQDIGGRSLEEGDDANIVNVVFFETVEAGAEGCVTDLESNACFRTNTAVDIHYDGGNTSSFRERLLTAIKEARLDDLFAGVAGLSGISNVTVVARDDDTDDDSAAGVGVGILRGEESGVRELSAGGIVAISLASIGLLLIILLLLRRRKSEKEHEHVPLNPYELEKEVPLEESMDSGDIATAIVSDMDSPAKEYKTRMIHVVGEDNSEISGWTGYTLKKSTDSLSGGSILEELTAFENATQKHGHGRFGFSNSPLGRRKATQNVHRCASATCEICIKNQYKPHFVSTGKTKFVPAGSDMIPPRLPAYARRVYVAPNTVAL